MKERTPPDALPARQQPESLRRLEDAVTAIQDSESFRRWLDVSSRFHTYSLGNQLLIAFQKPDATHVAGFNAWRKLNRFVRKGEKGIAIVVPHVRTVTNERGEEERRLSGYGTGYVFDVSQTEGEPLPEHHVPVLEGEAGAQLFDGLSSYAASEGVSVSTLPPDVMPRDVMGFYEPGTKRIVLSDQGQLQKTKTLAHELGHHVARVDDRAENECLAEGIAYVVCSHFGVDTGERSFPYVAGWAKDTSVLRSVLSTIQEASATIIDGVERSSSASI